MSSMLDEAVAWPKRGLHVFQLQPRSKIPFPGSRGCKDATRDKALIRDWWRQHPTANIGLATGDGYFVIDLDGPDAQRWFAEECGRRDCNQTLTVKTARGWHVFFWAPEEIPNSASKIAPHVDVRGQGGYVVGAPSIHPDGHVYRIVRDRPIATAPRWLIELAKPPVRPPAPAPKSFSREGLTRKALGIIGVVAAAKPGERNSLLHWGSCRIAEMISEGHLVAADGEALLFEAAAQAGLHLFESRATIASALRSGGRQHG
jgi:hypothetical protein